MPNWLEKWLAITDSLIRTESLATLAVAKVQQDAFLFCLLVAAMRAELEALLYVRYPSLFLERNENAEGSAMSRGFECGDGWFPLIDNLCALIEQAVDLREMPPLVVRQVKEKFGSLRFRYRGGNALTRGMVRMAVRLSEQLCAETGVLRRNEAADIGERND